MANKPAGHRARALEERRRVAKAEQVAALGADRIAGSLQSALALLASAGLPAPTADEIRHEPVAEQALAIGRILQAAARAIEIARRRAELVPATEARDRLIEFASAVRSALDRAPAYLPADLTPEAREAATAAMAEAYRVALTDLRKAGA